MPSGSLPKNYTTMRTIFSSSRAAIDLASIMVGVIIIGIIGGVIASTIFAVIPWAQDNAAKASLDSVHTAESAYAGFSVGQNGGQPKEYGNYDDLKNTDGSKTDSLLEASDKLIITTGSNSKDCYLAVITSDSGNQFWIDNDRNVPKRYETGDHSNCADLDAALGNGGSTAPVGNGASLPGLYEQGPGFTVIYHEQNKPYNFGTLPDPTCEPVKDSSGTPVTTLTASINGQPITLTGDWSYLQYEYNGMYGIYIQTMNGSIGDNADELQQFVSKGAITFIPQGCADSITFNLTGGSLPPGGGSDPQPTAQCDHGDKDLYVDGGYDSQTQQNVVNVDGSCRTTAYGLFTSYPNEVQTLGTPNLSVRNDGCWASGSWDGAPCADDGTIYSPGSLLQQWDAKNGTNLSFYKNGDSNAFYTAEVNTDSGAGYEKPRESSDYFYYTQDGYNNSKDYVEFHAAVNYNQSNYLNGNPAPGTTANSCLDEVQSGQMPTTYQSVNGTVDCNKDYNFRVYNWRYNISAGMINPDNYDDFKALSQEGGSVQFTTVEGKSVTIQLSPGQFNPTPQNT
jgi:hypothetical protein